MAISWCASSGANLWSSSLMLANYSIILKWFLLDPYAAIYIYASAEWTHHQQLQVAFRRRLHLRSTAPTAKSLQVSNIHCVDQFWSQKEVASCKARIVAVWGYYFYYSSISRFFEYSKSVLKQDWIMKRGLTALHFVVKTKIRKTVFLPWSYFVVFFLKNKSREWKVEDNKILLKSLFW